MRRNVSCPSCGSPLHGESPLQLSSRAGSSGRGWSLRFLLVAGLSLCGLACVLLGGWVMIRSLAHVVTDVADQVAKEASPPQGTSSSSPAFNAPPAPSAAVGPETSREPALPRWHGTPPPVDDAATIVWQRYSPLLGDYELALPGEPAEEGERITILGKEVRARHIAASAPGISCKVIHLGRYWKPDEVSETQLLEAFFEFYVRRVGESDQLIVESVEDVQRDGAAGRLIRFASENGHPYRDVAEIYAWEGEAHAFVCTRGREVDISCEEKFFHSIRLGKQLAMKEKIDRVMKRRRDEDDEVRDVKTRCEWRVPPVPAPTTSRRLARKPLDMGEGRFQDARFTTPEVGVVAMLVEDEQQYYVQRHNLGSGRLISRFGVVEEAELLDIRPDGQLIAVQTGYEEGRVDQLDIWHCLASSQELIMSWTPERNSSLHYTQWAAFVGQKHFLTLSNLARLDLWELPKGTPQGMLEIDEDAPVALSHDRSYLATSRKQDIEFYDCQTLELIGRLEPFPLDETELSCMAISADGETIAVVFLRSRTRERPMLALWDLRDGSFLRALPIPVRVSQLQWCGTDHLLADEYLVDLQRGMVTWTYHPLPLANPPDSRYWFQGSDSAGLYLAAGTVPGEQVAEIIAGHVEAGPPLAASGQPVKLQVEIDVEPPSGVNIRDRLVEVFTKHVEIAGGSVSDSADVSLHVDLHEQDLGGTFPFVDQERGVTIDVPNRQLVVTHYYRDADGRARGQGSIAAGVATMVYTTQYREPAKEILDERWIELYQKLDQAYFPTVDEPKDRWSNYHGFGKSGFGDDRKTVYDKLRAARAAR